jgi:CheY-like chemotaxis protein
VIWCTAYDREDLRREAKALAVDAYLLKPLDLDALYRAVAALAEVTP